VTIVTSVFVVFVPYNYPCSSARKLVDHVSDNFPYYNSSLDGVCVNREFCCVNCQTILHSIKKVYMS
jgi:hypothetical protein